MKRELPFAVMLASTADELARGGLCEARLLPLRIAQRCAQGVAEQVAQRGVAQAFTETVALAKACDADDGFAHWLHHIGHGGFHLLKIHKPAHKDHEYRSGGRQQHPARRIAGACE